jgi:hypothetical protein
MVPPRTLSFARFAHIARCRRARCAAPAHVGRGDEFGQSLRLLVRSGWAVAAFLALAEEA